MGNEEAVIVYNDAAAFLTSVLKGIQSVVAHARCIYRSVGDHSEYAAFLMYTHGSALRVLCCSADETFEKRMRSVGTALKFRMVLNAYEERLFCDLNSFNKVAVGRYSAQFKSV